MPESGGISFPTTELPGPGPHAAPTFTSSQQHRQHLLSFRRISLPTAPSLRNRLSTTSIASQDSLTETGTSEAHPSNRNKTNALQIPVLVEVMKRAKKRDSHKKPDSRKATKCRKIISEFYTTERAYVDGLDLIYSVCYHPLFVSFNSNPKIVIPNSIDRVSQHFHPFT